jgi:hypothetical protein
VRVTARRKTTTEIERHYFERFRKAYALQAGSVTYGDKPDVTLTGERTIGIEITRFYLQVGRGPDLGRREIPVADNIEIGLDRITPGALHRSPPPPEQFVDDSPLEGTGFEPSVPGREIKP